MYLLYNSFLLSTNFIKDSIQPESPILQTYFYAVITQHTTTMCVFIVKSFYYIALFVQNSNSELIQSALHLHKSKHVTRCNNDSLVDLFLIVFLKTLE